MKNKHDRVHLTKSLQWHLLRKLRGRSAFCSKLHHCPDTIQVTAVNIQSGWYNLDMDIIMLFQSVPIIHKHIVPYHFTLNVSAIDLNTWREVWLIFCFWISGAVWCVGVIYQTILPQSQLNVSLLAFFLSVWPCHMEFAQLDLPMCRFSDHYDVIHSTFKILSQKFLKRLVSGCWVGLTFILYLYSLSIMNYLFMDNVVKI